MNPSCAAPGVQNSSAALARVLGSAASNGGINFGADLQCTNEVASYRANASAVNRDLYCGFYQVGGAKCCTNRVARGMLATYGKWLRRVPRNAHAVSCCGVPYERKLSIGFG